MTLAAIAGVYAFWPAETKPIAEPKDTRHLQKEEKRALQTESKIARYDGVYLKEAQARKIQSKPPEWDQKQNYFTDTETDFQYKPSRQLSKAPGRYYKQYGITAKKTDSPYLSAAGSEKTGEPPQWRTEQFNSKDRTRSLELLLKSLKSKKPVERVRPEPPEGAELKISEEQMQKMHESVLLHLLEEYKDNPEQAKQIRKILLERLKHHQKKREATAKEANSPD